MKIAILRDVKTIQTIAQFPSQALVRGSVVTIGNFDGVHLGHKKLIDEVKRKSSELGLESIVFTFEPHPVQVLFPERRLKRLFPREDQEEQLGQLGMDYLVVQPFSRALSQTPPLDFLEDYIYRPLRPRALVVGYDFSFGANRQGGVQLLEDFSKRHGVSVDVVPAFTYENDPVSSTRVRKIITGGDMKLARALLGRNFYLQGLVQKGDRRGTKIGFPTANMTSIPETIPKKGVYATFTLIDGKRHRSLTNIGTNPTFQDSDDLRVETHILNFNEFIYGQEIRVEFLERLRDEQKFSGVEALKSQIKSDIAAALKVFDEVG
jgi:riboflavin kinase / FMN adenylyltransferase